MPDSPNHSAIPPALHPHPSLVVAYEYEWGNSRRVFRPLIEYNTAYLVVAGEAGVVPAEALAHLVRSLVKIGDDGFDALDYRPERDGLQPNIEAAAAQRAGAAAGWLSVGRARQECELNARQIVVRDALLDVLGQVRDLSRALLALARRHDRSVMPFHTWAQHAEPVTFGYYLAATTRALLDDHARIEHAFVRLNRSRGGIGQVVPPPMPVDRGRLAELLGFDGILPNSLHGYSSLDLELAVLSSLAIFTANLARFAETLFLWASTDFGFLRFGSSFTGTSYAMPHKRNPYALRLARPAAARVAGALAETTQLFAGGLELVGNGVIHVPNRTIEAIDVVRDLCAVLAEAIPTIEVNRSRMHASAVGGMGSSPQLVFHLVEHHGIPYRQAHELTGRIVSRAMAEGISLVHLPAAVIEEVINDGQQPGHAIDTDALARALDPEAVVASRGGGGPSPESVATEIESMSTALLSIDAALDVHRERRRQGRERLARRVGAILESGRG